MYINKLFIWKWRNLALFKNVTCMLGIVDSSREHIGEKEYEMYFKIYEDEKSNIFQRLLTKSYTQQQLKKATDDYFHSLTYKRNPNTILGLLYLSKNIKDDNQTNKRLLQYIIRIQNYQSFSCTEASLLIFLKSVKMMIEKSHQKIKQSAFRYLAAEIIKNNKKVLKPNHIKSIVDVIAHNQRNLVSHRIRFIEIANILHQIISPFLTIFINKKSNFYDFEILRDNFDSILHFYQYFPPQNHQHAQIFYFFLESQLSKKSKIVTKLNLYKIFKAFPADAKSKEGKYYKQMLFQAIIKYKRKYDTVDEANRQKGKMYREGLLWYSMLNFEFYKMMKSRQFKYQGQLNYLTKQDIERPELSNQAWQQYKLHFESINKDYITQDIVSNHYPEKYIKSKYEIEERRKQHPMGVENEMKTRISLALINLGYQYQKEVEVAGRFVDFVLQDKILIECDGDYHFNLHKMEYNEQSQFRNLHYLLSGYKLIIIHIYEYNEFRRIEQMQDLIKLKVDCLKQNNAVFVI